MRKTFLFILLQLAGSLAFAEGSPRISFTHEAHDFGRVIQGKIVEYTFYFENKGIADLWIKEVTTSCGCTAALVSASQIKPGERGELKVSYDSQGRAGSVTRTITIVSNDPVEPVKELTITATVDPSMHTSFDVNESLFSEKCGGCHFNPASNKQGKELYDAVCTFCHGRTASALDGLKVIDRDNLDNKIKNGIKGTEMPAWIKDLGGTLNEDEVRSLIGYIKGE